VYAGGGVKKKGTGAGGDPDAAGDAKIAGGADAAGDADAAGSGSVWASTVAAQAATLAAIASRSKTNRSTDSNFPHRGCASDMLLRPTCEVHTR